MQRAILETTHQGRMKTSGVTVAATSAHVKTHLPQPCQDHVELPYICGMELWSVPDLGAPAFEARVQASPSIREQQSEHVETRATSDCGETWGENKNKRRRDALYLHDTPTELHEDDTILVS